MSAKEQGEATRGGIKGFFKKGDFIIAAVLVAAVILSLVFATGSGGDNVEIYVDGKLVYQLDLYAETEIELLDGAMLVCVKDGRVWVEESDCDEQLCVHAAPIGKDGGMIVCLPNKVVVKIATREVDAVT
jgi:hypothetical protein